MSKLIRISPSFINIRASFTLGPLDIGAQASLVKRKNGKYLILDSVSLDKSVQTQVAALTDGGKDIEAILNVRSWRCPNR